MKFLLVTIALLLILILSLLNAFHILSLSQKNLKKAREKLIESILFYFDLLPRQLLVEGLLDSDKAKNYFDRRSQLATTQNNLQTLHQQYKSQVAEFNNLALTTQSHIVAEQLHTYNQSIIRLEHLLNGGIYTFLGGFLKIKPPKHISE